MHGRLRYLIRRVGGLGDAASYCQIVRRLTYALQARNSLVLCASLGSDDHLMYDWTRTFIMLYTRLTASLSSESPRCCRNSFLDLLGASLGRAISSCLFSNQ